MTTQEQFAGSLIGGAIGDAYGSSYEQAAPAGPLAATYYPFGKPVVKHYWTLTDDTQLTLATCEAIAETGDVNPEVIAQRFLTYFQKRQLTGLGASTLKALQELSAGGHWSQAGREGEYGAGNGAAMRVAPLAFLPEPVSRQILEDVCRITHQHPEAYTGALAVVLSLQAVRNGTWTGHDNLLPLVLEQLPDTRVRDRLLELNQVQNTLSLGEMAARFGSSGYVVDSVPLALTAANQVRRLGFEAMLAGLVAAGGDTDTNCSLAGQLSGALLGVAGIPRPLYGKLQQLPEFAWVQATVTRFNAAILS
ncbi:ADP-ribosylglycohydrolase family protein [Hymenobacter cellulosilyticus]|uniref:ADP-ribosylglycohydrolase family protein n=1 Tax=Hymenobacter cellulosilyticus TaxID=2932248 RepID=A0A8T9PZJ1_9BACT|nr:ADP-ribosylglycohydrolase family protein [Hymenobacter cellulosilyticus]UOQ70507.1 ADP-ribosylglycohydrolase family protein [Hymenobacter cellulosilyticus]